MIQNLSDSLKGIIYAQWEHQKKRERESNRGIFEVIITDNFPKINNRHQTTDAGSSEVTKQEKCQNTTPRHIIFKLQKIKYKEKIPKEKRRKKTLPTEVKR